MSRKTVLYIILFFLYMGFNPFRIIGMNELKAEIVPKITMIKDITIANIGRFIKNLDNYSTP